MNLLLIISLLVGSCLSLILPSDYYYRPIFERQVMEDERIEKLLFMNSKISRADDDEFVIGLLLKDGRRIAVQVEGSIYNFGAITEIDNYKIEVLELCKFWRREERRYVDRIVYMEKLYWYYLERILNKEPPYFSHLNAVLNCYDEIKEVVEKIYNEGPIPGSFDEIGYDASRWGEDEELINYTGYIIDGASSFHERLKIYVKHMESGFHR
jgi:hypothetical protein